MCFGAPLTVAEHVQNALPPPPPKPPPEKPPPPPPPPPNPEPLELARGDETKTWCMSLAMLCMELEKKIGLKARTLPATHTTGRIFHDSGECLGPVVFDAQRHRVGQILFERLGGMRFNRSASTRFMNSWKPRTATCVRAPFTVFAVMRAQTATRSPSTCQCTRDQQNQPS